MPYGKDVFVLPHLGEGSKRGDNNDHGDNAGSETESLGCSEHVQHEPRQRDCILPPFEIENGGCPESASLVRGSASIRGRQQQQQQRPVGRPSRKLLLARPSPFEPITDPFAFVCEVARRPKFGHQYVLCPGRRKRGDHIGYSVGPHWAGVIYTISMIGVITIFLVRFIVNDVAAWCQPVTVACSLVTVGFLVATAVADPGIVVESAEEGEACAYCVECDIWRPDGAEHCEECGVCIFGMDHHCPWMGKCIGKGNMVWFKLFNGSWILFLSFVIVSVPYFNNHKGSSEDP